MLCMTQSLYLDSMNPSLLQCEIDLRCHPLVQGWSSKQYTLTRPSFLSLSLIQPQDVDLRQTTTVVNGSLSFTFSV